MFKRLTAEVDGADIEAGEQTWEDEELGNQFDTELTLKEILEHNQVYDRLCKSKPSGAGS